MHPPYPRHHTHPAPPCRRLPAAFEELFAALDRCEGLLGQQRYIAGDRLTEADIRLFMTLIRFDPVYVVRHGACKHRQYLHLAGSTQWSLNSACPLDPDIPSTPLPLRSQPPIALLPAGVFQDQPELHSRVPQPARLCAGPVPDPRCGARGGATVAYLFGAAQGQGARQGSAIHPQTSFVQVQGKGAAAATTTVV